MKGEKVAAEMLAAMYDASLDQFKPHYWEGMNLFPTLYNNYNWQEAGNFGAINSEERNEYNFAYEYYQKSYDRLIGSNQYYGGGAMMDMAAPMMKAAAPAPEGAAREETKKEVAQKSRGVDDDKNNKTLGRKDTESGG